MDPNTAPAQRTPPEERPQITLLRPESLRQFCVQDHRKPSADLAPFVAVAWTMAWNLADGESFTQRVLPNPSVQIVIREAQAAVIGIVTGAFSATFTGKEFVFALRFRPCGFQPFAAQPVAAFTNRHVPLARIVPDVSNDRLVHLAAHEATDDLLEVLEQSLRRKLPVVEDRTREDLERFIGQMEKDSAMLTVDDAARAAGVSTRTLQRHFRNYVGVSPKWMLRRYRLKEAAARVEAGEQHNWAEFAQNLGYFDQSHLIADFKRMLGQPPAAYSRKAV